jgi:hypothetical protein
MASWWKEDKKFTNWSNGWYETISLREPYIYLMALICWLYEENDCSKFLEAWMSLAYTMAIFRRSFNLGAIISKQLIICVQQAQMLKEGEALTFYMASYLLDVMCARNVFADMNFSWHVAELSVHVYFNILWENRYKKYYALICDEFITPYSFYYFQEGMPKIICSSQENGSKSRPLVFR